MFYSVFTLLKNFFFLKFTPVSDNAATLNGVHIDTVASSPKVMMKCSICSYPHSLTRTPPERLKKNRSTTNSHNVYHHNDNEKRKNSKKDKKKLKNKRKRNDKSSGRGPERAETSTNHFLEAVFSFFFFVCVEIRTLSPDFSTRSPLQETTPQIHNKSWRSGNLHHSAWVEGHTGGSRSIPAVHPCSKNGRRLSVARKHHNHTSLMGTNHTRNYHMVAEHVPRSTARQGAGKLRIEEVFLRVDQGQGSRKRRVVSRGGVPRQAQCRTRRSRRGVRLRLQGSGELCPVCLRGHCCNGARPCSESPSISTKP